MKKNNIDIDWINEFDDTSLRRIRETIRNYLNVSQCEVSKKISVNYPNRRFTKEQIILLNKLKSEIIEELKDLIIKHS